MIRMHWTNKKLLFPEYRNSVFFLVYKMIRYCMLFQILFYSVMGNYFFLGSMDHLLARPGIVSATNKDSITMGRCTALWELIKFNTGSWAVSLFVIGLSYATWLHAVDWDYTVIPDIYDSTQLSAMLFAGPATVMAVLAFFIPIILNPFVLGWPFNPPLCRPRKVQKKEKMPNVSTRHISSPGSKVVDLHTFMNSADPAARLEKEAGRVQDRPDVELGSLATNDFGPSRGGYPISVANPDQSKGSRGQKTPAELYGMGKTRSEPASKQNLSRPQGRQSAQTLADKNRIKLAMI